MNSISLLLQTQNLKIIILDKKFLRFSFLILGLLKLKIAS